jgi:hypothetical protein
VTLVEGAAVPARRSRAELALVVAEWGLAWRDEDDYSCEVPTSLFRSDEVATVESLEAGELLAAGGCLVDCVADHIAQTKRRKARGLRRFADSLYSRAERWYALRAQGCRPRVRPRERRATPVRRFRCSGPPSRDGPGSDGGDEPPDDPDVEHRARRGWSR